MSDCVVESRMSEPGVKPEPKLLMATTMAGGTNENGLNHDNNDINGEDVNSNDVRASDSDDTRNILAIVALCLCSLSNALLLISVFPYSGYMVLFLLPNTERENVGVYAGFLAASFMAGRVITAYSWGQAGDTYGRIVVLQSALLFSAILSVVFGTAESFAMAIFWRLCLGMSNGVISIVKTCSLEIAHGNERKEVRGMGIVMGSRSYGMLLAPAIGGFLAEPLTQYPRLEWLHRQDRWWYSVLKRYPFLLPNLVVATICLVSAIAVAHLVEETLARDKRRNPRFLLADIATWASDRLQGIACAYSEGEKLRLLPNSSEPRSHTGVSDRSLWSSPITRQHMFTHWAFSFYNTSVDEAFPLFCMSTVGGLGMIEYSIGQILSTAGILFVVFQYVVYAKIVHSYGLYGAISIGCIGAILPVMFTPLSVILLNDGVATWLVHLYLSVVVGSIKIMTCLFFTSLSLATNKTVKTVQRGKLNALVTVGVSVGKGFGPILSGGLVTISFSSKLIPAQCGSIIIYVVLALVGLCVFSRARCLQKTMTRAEPSRVDSECQPRPIEQSPLMLFEQRFKCSVAQILFQEKALRFAGFHFV